MAKKQVLEALESARANLDQAIADLEIKAETVGYTAHKLNNYLTIFGATVDLLHISLSGHPDEQVQVWVEGLQDRSLFDEKRCQPDTLFSQWSRAEA